MSSVSLLALSSDPELFLYDKNGKLADASDYIRGTKDRPEPLGPGQFQHDNIMAELNPPPARTCEEFIENTSSMLSALERHLEEHGVSIRVEASASMSALMREMSSAAGVMGCAGDINAWTGKDNDSVSAEQAGHLRAAGGHLHMSLHMEEKDLRREVVKMLDITLGLPSVLEDNDNERRNLYGKAGSYRLTTYPGGLIGLEYRVLSNFWLRDTRAMSWAYSGVARAIRHVDHGYTAEGILIERDIDPERLVSCINNGDRKEAEELISLVGSAARRIGDSDIRHRLNAQYFGGIGSPIFEGLGSVQDTPYQEISEVIESNE